MAKQDIRLAITEKGEKHLAVLYKKGFTNITWEQRTEWDILHDIMPQQGYPEGIEMGMFLAEGRNTILGRKFETFSEHGERGQLAMDSYGRTLRRLITEGYIKAWVYKKEGT